VSALAFNPFLMRSGHTDAASRNAYRTHMTYKKVIFLLPFVLLASAPSVAAQPVQSIRAGASAETSIFLDAKYTQSGTENPVVQEATVFIAKKNSLPEPASCKQRSIS